MLGNYAKFPRNQNSESSKMRNKSTHKSDNGVQPIMPTSPGCCRPFNEKEKITLCLQNTHTLSQNPQPNYTQHFLSKKDFPHTRISLTCEMLSMLEWFCLQLCMLFIQAEAKHK